MRRIIVCLVVCGGVLWGTSAAAQTSATPERGWLDVNFGGLSPAEGSIETTSQIIQNAEVATYGVGYSFPRAAEFDFGGGVMFSPTIGLGVSFMGTASESDADLFVAIPHPLRFNSYGTDSDVTEGLLKRTERSTNIHLLAKAPIHNDQVRVRFYGGPSYFQAKADAVSDIRYLQNFGVFTSANVVDITNYATKEVEATGWGFNAGADVAYMLTRVFGLGSYVRFTRGTVTVADDDVLTVDEPLDVKVGGFSFGGGIRLRF